MFDLDGTLVDSMGYWRGLPFDFLSERFGVTDIPDDIRDIVLHTPNNTDVSLGFVCKKLGLPPLQVERSEVLEKMSGYYNTEINLKPYVREFISKLRAENVRCAVATATPRAQAEAVIEKLGLSDCFSFLLTTQEVGADKDEPLIFDAALERFSADRKNTVVFEDAYYSIKTLYRCGFRTVGIEDEYARDFRERIVPLCERYITGYKELL